MSYQNFSPKLDYSPSELAYLHCEETHVIWNKISNYIKSYQSKYIVDIGCATGAINFFLTDYSYKYYGIDKSPLLIEEAKNIWINDNMIFEYGDWNDITHKFDHQCDCLLLLGVLPYAMPEYGHASNDSPWDMYNRLIKKFNPKQVIIRETANTQNGIPLDIPTVDLTPFLDIATDVEYINVNTILGNKVLIHVTC